MSIRFDNLINDSNNLRRDVLEFGENVGNKFIALWDTLLDTDGGISEEAYNRLLELGLPIDPVFIERSSSLVDATNGHFFIPEKVYDL